MAGRGEGPDYAEELSLQHISWSGRQLNIWWAVDELSFTTTMWFETVDFRRLEAQLGGDAVASLAFHIAMFEIDKGASFAPSRLTIADPWHDLLSDDLFELWRVVIRNVWAQWRYEHDLPDYEGPRPNRALHASRPPLMRSPPGDDPHLWFCGGGKDSLLASELLAEIGEPFDALEYSHSIYGRQSPQIELIDRLVDSTDARTRHRIYMYDTSTDLPLGKLGVYPRVGYVLAAETPASLFAALPVALAHGHRNLMVAHERSANTGNLVWPASGEDINHQWGKSLEAEDMLAAYVRSNLAPEVDYFSLLQPVDDALIFASLRGTADRIPLAHSCNVAKPWCMRCPKCAYVWICYKAWLPWGAVDAVFGGANLTDLEENQLWYRQMLGLESHTPFDCIGQVDEVRLAFKMADARGLRGRAMTYLDEVGPVDAASILDRYLSVGDDHRIPDRLAPEIIRFFRDRAVEARRFADDILAKAGTTC